MGRWRSGLSSLTILGLLFWLGTAMAPTVSSSAATNLSVESATAPPMTEEVYGQVDDLCSGSCEPEADPLIDSGRWRLQPVFVEPLLLETGPAKPLSQPQAPVTAARVPPPGPARAPAPAPAPRPVSEWTSLVSAYFAPEDVELALRVISCESGGDPNAQNRRSGAAGLFQHIPRYWEPRAAAVGMAGASIFDPVANVAAAAWLVATEGWRPWAASAHCWG